MMEGVPPPNTLSLSALYLIWNGRTDLQDEGSPGRKFVAEENLVQQVMEWIEKTV